MSDSPAVERRLAVHAQPRADVSLARQLIAISLGQRLLAEHAADLPPVSTVVDSVPVAIRASLDCQIVI